jgi:hypothetical protein
MNRLIRRMEFMQTPELADFYQYCLVGSELDYSVAA